MDIKKMMWWMSSNQPVATSFKQITIDEWKQFKSINIEFHTKLTILTGANASGKTTILNLLAKHFDWHSTELSTPVSIKGAIQYLKRWLNNTSENVNDTIGEVKYENQRIALLQLPNDNELKFTINISNKQLIDGFYVPSYRHGFSYHAVNIDPPLAKNIREILSTYFKNIRKNNFESDRKPSNYYIKEMLLTWSSLSEENFDAKKYLVDFENILRNSLPKTLGFIKFEIRTSEVILITKAGEYLLDGCSGGISMLIDLTWNIYLFSLQSNKKFTVIIDEVENHLHPAMQREVLTQLLAAFPDVQFIVATHSPLIVSSVKDSNVYALRYIELENGDRKVISELLDLKNKAKTATEVLNEILGVPFTMPIWVEDKLNKLADKYTKQGITESTFDTMRAELKEMGLEELMPEAMKKTLNK